MIFKKYRNKKGFANDIMIAILAIAALLILTLFAYKAYVSLKEKMAVQSCKNSIDAHSFIARLSVREIFTDIKCPTNEITIKDLKKSKETIAEDMHRCWYIWSQGKKEYFKGDGNFCFVCSVYKFGDKGQQVDGFMKYLTTQPIQIKYPTDTVGLSYQDYFQGYETPNSANMVKAGQIQATNQLDYLNTSQKYASVFVYASGKDAVEKALEGGGRTATLAGGGIAIALGTIAGVSGTTTAIGAAIAGGAVNIWNPLGWALLAGVGIYAVYKATHPEEPQWTSFIAFRPYNETELNDLNCEQLVVNQMSNAGK